MSGYRLEKSTKLPWLLLTLFHFHLITANPSKYLYASRIKDLMSWRGLPLSQRKNEVNITFDPSQLQRLTLSSDLQTFTYQT